MSEPDAGRDARPNTAPDGWRVAGFTEVRELGSGAQGRVVLARHATAGTPVAIKYLARRDGDERAIERLRGEAVLLGRVDDPHVVRLYRFVAGEHGAALVMEAVNGVSLKEILAEHGALEPEAALTVLKGSLLGLGAAHRFGVVHRDYKPANVVVQADGLSKLIDFGVAALAGEEAGSGTPAYMAPEQWERRPATAATDVYAATCVFFECVTGHRPFGGAGVAALAAGHLREPVPVRDVPEALRDLIVRGMAKSPGDRQPGAAAFVAELETAAAAAYGPDWERRGARALAGAAVALAAVFPLIAAGLVPAGSVAAGAVAGGTVAGGTVAGGAVAGGTGGTVGGGAVAGGGVFAATGAKVAAAVVTTAVAAGGAGVYAVGPGSGPDRPAASRSPAGVVVRPMTLTHTADRPTAHITGRYPRVTGLSTAALETKVNALLREPVETWARSANADMTAFTGPDDPRTYTGRFTYDLGLSGPRFFSVRYTFAGTVVNRNTAMKKVVTVDLSTGRAMRNRDLLTPYTFTRAGGGALTRLLTEYGPGGVALCEGPFWDSEERRYTPTLPEADAEDLTAELIDKGVTMLPTRKGLDFYLPLPSMGYSMACGREWRVFSVPYGRLGRFVRPELVQAAGAPSP